MENIKKLPLCWIFKGTKSSYLEETSHKAKFTWAKKYVSLGDKWSDVVKWDLDVPDGFHCYWYDLRKEKNIFKKCQSGGGSVMTWGVFSSHGIFKLVLVSGNMDSKQYTDMLSEHFLGDFFRIAGNRAIFQQDNTPIHVSRHSKAVFSDKNVVLMDWPALSPDVNPIVNLWGIVARQVYGQGKQYDSKVSLTGTIMKSWSEIDDQTVKSLIGSMKNDCI